MAEGDAARAGEDSWVDDLATIVAGWRDARPVRNRLLLLVAAIVAFPRWPGQGPLLALAFLGMLLPRVRFGAGTVARALGALLVALGGAAAIAAAADAAPLGARTLGAVVVSSGLLLGARRGPWWPWLLPGLLLVPLRIPWASIVTLDWSVVGGTLAVLVVARTAFASNDDASVRTARDRLAVRVQRRPWVSATALVALAMATPSAVSVGAIGVHVALICVAFHATWRASSLFERVAPWAAAAMLPGAATVMAYGPSASAIGGGAGQIADLALSPVWLFPLAAGFLVGRRAPAAESRRSDAIGVVGACCVALMLLGAVELWWMTQIATTGVATTASSDIMRFGAPVAGLPFLIAFHLAATSAIPGRTIVRGSIVLGVAELALHAAIYSRSYDFSVPLSAIAPAILAWIGAGVVCLLARDVVRVTHIPSDHPIVTDWTPRDARA